MWERERKANRPKPGGTVPREPERPGDQETRPVLGTRERHRRHSRDESRAHHSTQAWQGTPTGVRWLRLAAICLISSMPSQKGVDGFVPPWLPQHKIAERERKQKAAQHPVEFARAISDMVSALPPKCGVMPPSATASTMLISESAISRCDESDDNSLLLLLLSCPSHLLNLNLERERHLISETTRSCVSSIRAQSTRTAWQNLLLAVTCISSNFLGGDTP